MAFIQAFDGLTPYYIKELGASLKLHCADIDALK